MAQLLSAYISLVRWPNLLILGLVQGISFFVIFSPEYVLNQAETTVSTEVRLLLILCTLLITASGYVVNDTHDTVEDSTNKPTQQVVDKVLSRNTAWKFYFGMVGLGGLTASYIAYRQSAWALLPIYPLAVAVLYYYARFGKKTGLLGNIVVALMTSGAVLLPLLALQNEVFNEIGKIQYEQIGYFAVFSGLINLIREWVKDLQDVPGDQQAGVKSMPIRYGVYITKSVIIGCIIFLILALITWIVILDNPEAFRIRFFGLIFCLAPLALSIQRLQKAEIPLHYKRISTLLKLVMVTGTILLLMQFYSQI